MQKADAKKLPLERPYPDKLFYKIGEVSRIADVEPYVLRYWESEFPFLKPRKSKSGQRVYVKKDLELILEIKQLLYSERYTIEGVRKRFAEGLPGPHEGLSLTSQVTHTVSETSVSMTSQKETSGIYTDTLKHVKQRLRDILSTLA